MANVNAPFGFRPLLTTLAGVPCRVGEYGKVATEAQAIFMNDPVFKIADSIASPTSPLGNKLTAVSSAYAAGFTPGTTLIVGVSLNYGAASTATPHYLIDSIDALFQAQVKTGTTVTVASHVGKNANISKTTAGSTATKQSGLAVDGATLATTSTLDVRVLRLSNISPNAEGDSAIVEVLINKHIYGQGVTSV